MLIKQRNISIKSLLYVIFFHFILRFFETFVYQKVCKLKKNKKQQQKRSNKIEQKINKEQMSYTQQIPEQDMQRFSKEMEDKFMKDLQNISVGDSDSQLEGSNDFYQGLKKRITGQMTAMRQSTTANMIVNELKATVTKQLTNAQQFQQELKQMKYLTTEAKSVIAEQKIMEIKTRLAMQKVSDRSKLILSQQRVLQFEQVELQQENQDVVSKSQRSLAHSSSSMRKRPQKATTLKTKPKTTPMGIDNNESMIMKNTQQFTKKKTPLMMATSTANKNIEKKLNEINLQRERINMQREDQRSLRYQQERMKQFFSDRFISFPKPNTSTIRMPESGIVMITKPKATFSNLQPLTNNQKNVMPRNSPQLALKALKKSKRVSLKAISQTVMKIQFKKVLSIYDYQQPNKAATSTFTSNNKPQQTQQPPQITNLNTILQPYLTKITLPLQQLLQISKSYRPRFIRSHLNQNEKISNIAIMEGGRQRSVGEIMDYGGDREGMGKLREFKLTFEGVTSLQGIQQFPHVQYIALQYNQIKQITQLSHSNNVIQLNLSNNLIRQCHPITNLTQLRYLNLSNNKLREFGFAGGKLEILELRRNNIQVVNQLQRNRYLRVIDMGENNLHELSAKVFGRLLYLQELNLQKNYIQSLIGIQNLLMLQRLNLSNNRLKQINLPLVYMFLNQLNLSYNQLKQVPNMFLPSLENMYFTNNKLTGSKIGTKVVYLPELKEINLDDNEIKGFSAVWGLIKYSKKLQIVKYDSNEYFLSVRQKVRQLYEAVIYKNMANLKIINLTPFDTGIKAYYDSVYSGYLEKGFNLNATEGTLGRVEQFITNILEENKVISGLENRLGKYYNQRFVEEEVFIKAKSITRAVCLEKLISMLGENIQSKGNIINKGKAKSITMKSTSKTKKSSLIHFTSQIYFHHDQFQWNLLRNVHKIKSLYFRFKYNKQKRLRYFLKQKDTLKALFKYIQDYLFQKKLKQVVRAFGQSIKTKNQKSAAIMIQKHWRGYKCRKLFKKMLKKLKRNNSDDDFQMEEVDLDEFDAHELPEFNFDFPEDVNFENYIIEPKYFQLAAEKQTKRKQNKGLQSIKEEEYQQKSPNPKMNNFIKQGKQREEKVNNKLEDDKLMKQWGFENPATLQALRWRKKRKEQMKKKEAEQNMTAAQRYQRFKMMHK